jgi:hypothetical protein
MRLLQYGGSGGLGENHSDASRPTPDALRQVNDLVILTAISGLSQRLWPELGNELRKAVPSITARLKAAT